MKLQIKYVLTFLLLQFLPTFTINGQEIATIDGIKYYLDNGEATIMVQPTTLYGNITIPENVTHADTEYKVAKVAESAFKGTKINGISLPNTIMSLGYACFESCTILESVILPKSITELGASCFAYCGSLATFSFPESINTIGPYCFQGCRKLNFVNLPNSITSLGRACFYGCESLTSITLPNSITSLAGQCFQGCVALESMVLPSSINSLGEECFRNCRSLTSIMLSDKISEIGYSCFFSCASLCQVECSWTDFTSLTMDTGIFSGIFSEAILYVPKGTKEMYASTEPWSSSFKTIIEKDGEEERPEVPPCIAPSISFNNKELTFYSETPGAEYHYSVSIIDCDEAVDAYSKDGKINLTAAYKITAWASAEGYTNSEKTTATLYFIDATLEGPTRVMETNAKRGVMVNAERSMLTVSGLDEAEPVEVYTMQGVKLHQARAHNGFVRFQVNDTQEIVVIKVGKESIKVQM